MTAFDKQAPLDGTETLPPAPLPMLFYTYFKTKIGKEVEVELKNDAVLTGTLVSIDPFLNFKLSDALCQQDHYSMSICAIRGSSVKTISMDDDSRDHDGLHDATRYKFM